MNHFESLSKNYHLDLDRLNTSEILIVVTDTAGKIIYINDKYVSFGYSPEEMIGQNTRIFKTGYHPAEFYQNLWGTILSGDVWKGEIQARRKDGSVVWKFMIIFPLLDDQHQPYHFLAFSTVISPQKEKEEQALRKEKQLSSIVETTNDVMGCCDQDGNIFYVNSTQILGYSVSETEGSNVRSYLDPEEIPKVLRVRDELVKKPDQPVSIEVNLKKKNGPPIPCLVTLKNYLDDPYVKGFVFIYHDISDRKHISQEMKQWLFFDDLTGLPNRVTFENELIIQSSRGKDHGTSFAVMLVDIDEFKYIYHSFELHIRDLLLQNIATRIKAAFDDKDVAIYRIGEDRFAIILKDIDHLEKVDKTAKKVISSIYKNPFHIDGKDFYISASVGISIFPDSGEDNEALLKHAEIAMYQAKNNGQNQYQIFSQKMDLYNYKQFTLRNGVRKALLNNEFCVYYQPRVNPATNEMVSAEALIRWHHPNWGMISPDEFIPIAEASGHIIPIGTWMIRKISLKLKNWEEQNIALKKISINLSALQLLHPDLVDTITSILNQTGIDSKWIEFEITESAMLDNEEQALKTIRQLMNLGFSFALDDFGTGYCSLNYLRKLPCDTIKIDKSLIDDINYGSDGYEIVEMIVALCRRLNKSIVAEGAETKEQVLCLQKLGCNEIQGYFYSKPINEFKFKKLLMSEISIQNDEAVHPINCDKYFQIPLEIPIPVDMTIDRIGHKKINIGSSQALIHNIGLYGLCFQSTLQLPVSKEIIFRFTTEISSNVIQVNGLIIWKKELKNDQNQYRIKFILKKSERETLVNILKNLQLS